MEKIYIDSDKKNQKQSFFKRFFNDKGSMAATVVIALVAVVGLVAFGFNQISFAADYATLPGTFVSAKGETTWIGSTATTDGIMPFAGYYTSDGQPIFCTEFDTDYAVEKTYTQGAEVTDQGLIYLMSQLYPNKPLTGMSLSKDPEVQVWVTQAAIWTYMYEIGDPKNQTFNSVPTSGPKYFYDNMRSVKSLYSSADAGSAGSGFGTSTPFFEHFGINKIIEQAKQYRTEPFVALTVSKNSDNISVTNDNKYYQTDLISVVGNTSSPLINSFESYSVDLSKTPSGTVLVDESGNVYDDVTKMQPTAKFYVRIPVDKVTEENKNLQISVLGNFKMYGGYEYTSGSYQKVVQIGVYDKSISKPLDIQLNYTPDVPNTGMSTAQTIYFIGLVVLLSGVGIIYANTKPEGSN